MLTTLPPHFKSISLALTSLLLAATAATPHAAAGWPACERDRVNNLVYHCVNPGQQCGATRKCVEVTGGTIVAWRDCKCRSTGAALTLMAGGWWSAEAMAPLVPDAPVPFVLTSPGGDLLEIVDANDINEAGDVLASQVLTEPTALSGTLTLMILAGPPDAMPVFITELNLHIDPFELLAQSTGPNTITLARGAEIVPGVYDQLGGAIRFDTGVPCTLTNDLFPVGLDITFTPALGLVDGQQFVLMPAWSFTLDDCFGSDDFDGYDTDASLHGLSGWKGWDNNPAFTALTSQLQARTGTQSVEVSDDTDLVHEMCTSSEGSWSFTAWQYIPSDFSAPGMGPNQGSWLLLLNTYQDGGPYDWSAQMQFNPNLDLLKIYDGQGNLASSVPYVTDRWVKIQTIIDLDEDWTRIYYDDNLITEYPWTGGILGEGGGALDVKAVDLFANGSSGVYYDDLKLEHIEIIEPPCLGDMVDSRTFQPPPDGQVNAADLAYLLGEWGDVSGAGSPADMVTSATFAPPPDGMVDGADLAVLLGAWGPCE